MKAEIADRVYTFIVDYTELHQRPPSVQQCAECCDLTTYRVRQAIARLRQQQRLSQTSLRLPLKREPKPRRAVTPAQPKPQSLNPTTCAHILENILRYHHEHQNMPTVRELAEACGYSVTAQVRWLQLLEQDGYIERTRKARGIRLLDETLLQTA